MAYGTSRWHVSNYASSPWYYGAGRYLAGAAGRYLANKAIGGAYHYAKRKLGFRNRGRLGFHGTLGGPLSGRPVVQPPPKGGRRMKARKVRKGRGRRRVRKYKRRTANPTTGFTVTYEKGLNVADKNCVHVGHCNMPAQMAAKALCGAFLRALLAKVGNLPYTPGMNISDLTTNDAVIVYYTIDHNTNSLSNFNAVVTLGTNDTFEKLLNTLWIAMKAAFSAIVYESQFKFVELRFVPASSSKLRLTIINLDGASVTYTSKSSLKIQNRSNENSSDQDADVVDALPITGKMYCGYGTGTTNRYANGSFYDFVCSTYAGSFTQTGTVSTTLDRGYSEPPDPRTLAMVKSTTPVRIDPGRIQYNNLYSTTHKNLDKMWNLFGFETAGTDYALSPYGKFCFISLEKVLEYENDPTLRKSITIACEQSIRMTCNLKLKKSNYLPPLNYVDQIADSN